MNSRFESLIDEVDVVFFDFDGVILDTEWPIFETYKELFIQEGQQLSIETYVQCIGSDFTNWSPEKHLEELTGKTYDWQTINSHRQIQIVEAVSKLTPMLGVVNLLEKLSDKKKAVVSSSTRSWVDKWLEKNNLTRYFDTVVCRGDAPRIKPAPDLYIEAARRFLIQPAKCLVIEDSMNGLLSAKAAGMKTLIVPNRLTEHLDFSDSDFLTNSLEEFV